MIENMHDWSLLRVQFDWEAGRVTAEFLDGKGSRTLVAEGVQELQIPRRMEWGPSASVNATSQVRSATGALVLKVEMQSGDVIEINADAFKISRVR